MKNKYIVVRPTTPKGKWKVLAQSAGSNATFYEVADSTSEYQARLVCVALERHHAEAEREVDAVKFAERAEPLAKVKAV